MGAAYLCAEAGISTAVIENQAAYISGWLKKLHDDRKIRWSSSPPHRPSGQLALPPPSIPAIS
jgi:hypothetical protein